jgi:hypothetical protein
MSLDNRNLFSMTWSDGASGSHGVRLVHLPSQAMVELSDKAAGGASLPTLLGKARRLLEKEVERRKTPPPPMDLQNDAT